MYKIGYREGHIIRYRINEVNEVFILEVIIYYRYFLLNFKKIPIVIDLDIDITKKKALSIIDNIIIDLNKITR